MRGRVRNDEKGEGAMVEDEGEGRVKREMRREKEQG